MSIVRTAFCLGVVVMLLPADRGAQERLVATATSTVSHIMTFCDRHGEVCAKGQETWSMFKAKAEFGARLVSDLIVQGATGPAPTATRPAADSSQPPAPMSPPASQPAARRGQPVAAAGQGSLASRGTLRDEDFFPDWRVAARPGRN